MTHEGIFRRRHLPHWDVDDKPVFLTACLAGSLSSAGLAKIRARRAQLERRPCPENLTAAEWQAKKEKLIFKLIDDLLDNHSPVTHLSDPRQAHIVRDAFLYFAGQRYQLFAFVVMPSHYHWLFLPLPSWIQQAAFDFKRRTPREVISHSIQSYTANQCNHVRGTSATTRHSGRNGDNPRRLGFQPDIL